MDALRRKNLRKALTKLYIHIRLKVFFFPVAKAWGCWGEGLSQYGLTQQLTLPSQVKLFGRSR